VDEDDDDNLVFHDFDRARRKSIRVPMRLAILSVLLFFPLGVPALVYAILADQHHRRGRFTEGRKACELALNYAIAAILMLFLLLGIAWYLTRPQKVGANSTPMTSFQPNIGG
jgi:Interferon-induced transmembrane protein